MRYIQQFVLSVFLLVFSIIAVAAPAGVNWQWDNPKPQANQFNAMVIDEASGSIVAVGALGTIVSSTDDGSNWSAQASGTRNHLNSVLLAASAGVVYVAGDSGTILSSPSNTFATWTTNDTGLSGTYNINDISWNEDLVNSVFVAVGRGGRVLTNDGTSTSWTLITSQMLTDADNLSGVSWSPTLNMFVAVSLSGRVVSSSDGSSWTLQAYTASSGFRGVVWDDVSSLFIAVGNSGLIATSPDAVTWTERTSNAGASALFDVVRQGSNLFVVGASSALVISSNNGVDWALVGSASITSNSLRGIASDSSSIMVAGEGGVLQRSTNAGAGWTDLLPASSVFDGNITDIVWNGNDLFVAVSNFSSTSLTSADGVNWAANASGQTPSKIIWDGSRFVGVVTSGIFTSNDGLSWNRETVVPLNGTVSFARNIAWDGAQYIVVGASGDLITSPDAAGNNWTIQSTGSSENLNAVNGDGPLRVVVGANATILTSTDGSSWNVPTTIPDISSRTLYDVAWSGSRYVAVGQVGEVLSSTDGATWVDRSGFTSTNLDAVIWDGSQFVTIGSGGFIYTSPDGISWTERDSVTATELNAIASGSGRLVAVGSGGTIVSSGASFNVGGTVSGLNGSLVLQNNAADNLLVIADGSFSFSLALTNGENYEVTVFAQPAGQTCSVSSATGTVGAADITSVSISCVNLPTYTIGGSISGLDGTVVLQNNAGDNLQLSSNGSFTFSAELNDGASYNVTVVQSPATQSCIVTAASGTVATADVTSVSVNCSNLPTYSIGGTISGLDGTVVLQNNAGDNLQLNSNGSFAFSAELIDGISYTVTVLQQPANQSCSVTADSGTVAGVDVSNISINCVENATGSEPATPAPAAGGGGTLNLYLLTLLSSLLLFARRYKR